MLSMTSALEMPVLAAQTDNSVIIPEVTKELKLWYDEEAPHTGDGISTINPGGGTPEDGWERWSLPLGNGYFGANVFGRTVTERIQLTEKSLANPYYTPVNGKSPSLGGLNNFSETYIDFNHENSGVTNYRRDLDLKTAVSTVSYDYNNVNYTREYFTTYPDNAMLIKLDASEPGALSFTLRPTIPYIQDYAVDPVDGASKHGTVVADADGNIILSGRMGYYNIDFEAQYRIIPNGGSMSYSNITNEAGETDGGTVTVQGADSAYIIITLGTNYEYNTYIFTETNPKLKLSQSKVSAHDKVSGYMSKACKYTYDQLKARHIEDYGSKFGRVSVDLGGEVPTCTTDELLNSYKAGEYNQYLEELYFQYGRYLLLASSREGTLPANLQGTWNRYNFSPWSSGYWHNINVQMNYWPAFNTNIAETFDAYVKYNEAYMPRAKYITNNIIKSLNPSMDNVDGDNGWSIGTGAYPYEVGGMRNGGNVGFTTKIYWDYYDFTRDEDLLRNTVYPVISSGARFITKTMKKDENGKYITIAADSPENITIGSVEGTTYDQSFAYENTNDTRKAAEILGIDPEKDTILKTIEEQIDKYDPIQIGYSGQVKEFREENYYGEIGEYNHRHISQLVGLYPGTLINSNTPAWLDGAIVTLTERGDKATGWGMAHRLNLWARTKRGNRTYQVLQRLLKTGTATNLWDLHPPFQIDGNLGGTAGIAEMLLQSHEGYIAPMSAMPDAWSDGSYTGLCARGNFEVSAAWENGQAKTFNIKSKGGNECSVNYPGIETAKVVTASGQNVAFTNNGKDTITFDTEKDETYIISNLSERVEVSPVSNLTVKSDIKYNFDLSWSASADAESYNIYKACENAPDYTFIANTRDTSFTHVIDASEDNKRMTYRVCAVNAGGQESLGTLSYVNPTSLLINDVLGEIFEETSMQIIVNADQRADEYRLYKKAADSDNYSLIATSAYPCIVAGDYDNSSTYAVTIAKGYYESDKYVVENIKEVDTSDELVEDSRNILLNTASDSLIFEGKSKPGGTYSAEKAFDGDLSTRWAVADSMGEYSVTIDLDGIYQLKTMQIYDFRNTNSDRVDGVLATRSDKTSVELYSNGVWTTVISEQPLTLAKAYTEFDLGFSSASKLRITFNNTKFNSSASIYEITCTAAKQKFADRRALLAALEEAESIDISGLNTIEQKSVRDSIADAISAMQMFEVTQAKIDEMTELLDKIKGLIASGDTDILRKETDIYKGDTQLSIGSLTDDVKSEYRVGGVGGKTAGDYVYKLSGTPAHGASGANTFALYTTAAEKNHIIEFNFMMGTDNTGFYANMGFFNKLEKGNFGATVLTVSKDGFVVGSNPNIKTESSRKLAECEVGKWYKIAIVAPCEGTDNDTIYIYINGEKYDVKLAKTYYAQRHGRIGMLRSSAYSELYYDNVCQQLTDEMVYNPNRDKLNVLESATGGVTVSGQTIDANGQELTVAALKEQTSSDIRVYRNGYDTLLADTDTIADGDTVVAFAKNLRDYERTYNYYTVSNTR